MDRAGENPQRWPRQLKAPGKGNFFETSGEANTFLFSLYWRRVQVGFIASRWKIEASIRKSYDYLTDDPSRHRLFLPGSGRVAAERQGGGSGRRFWRDGFTDRVWSPWVGYGPIQSHHDCRHAVHGDIAFARYSDDAQRCFLRQCSGTAEGA